MLAERSRERPILNNNRDIRMSKENRDYLELSFKSIQCFANDGKLLLNEFQELIDIALRDGVVDDNEKRVLGNIIARLSPAELTKEMLEQIEQLRTQHAF